MSKTILPKFRIGTVARRAGVEVCKYRQGFAFDFPPFRGAPGIMDSGSCLILRFDPSSRLTNIDIMRTAREIRVGGADYLLVVLAHELGHAAYGEGDIAHYYGPNRLNMLPRLDNILRSENMLRRELGISLRASYGLNFKPDASQIEYIQNFR